MEKNFKRFEYTHVEELTDGDILYCPKCCKEIESFTNTDWQYVDGEKKTFTCKCGQVVQVECQRPILLQIFKEKEI